jgi:lysophospholipase L1-like esterase
VDPTDEKKRPAKGQPRPDATDPSAAPPKPDAHEAAFGELLVTLQKDDEDEVRRLAIGHRELVGEKLPVTKKVLVTFAALGLLVAVPYATPKLTRARVLTEGISLTNDGSDEDLRMQKAVPPPVERVGEMGLPGETFDQQNRADELERGPADPRGPIAQADVKNVIPAALDEGKPPISLDDPSQKALDHFFERLMAAERKEPGAIVRIVYYGDSIVASDFITGKLRRLLQSRFGDAGHGYALVANAFPGWFHIDVSRKASDQWKTSRCIGPYAEDGLYGLGCVSFTARKPDEWFSMGTADRDEWGRSASRFELEYLAQPGGGDVDILLDGKKVKSLSTEGPEKKVAYEVVTAPDGPHTCEVRTTTDKPTRLFGMRMERDVPGVTLSALGITGARARFLDKQDDAHWAEVLKAAKPDLVVLAFGTNEITDGRMAFDENGQLSKDPMGDYDRNLKKVMDQVRAAVPEASLMLVGPPDMASKKADEGNSKAIVPVIVDHQKALAAEGGWAFWNQFKAMGGAGSMWAWVQAGMGNTDMIHPTGSGGNVLGKMEYLALMEKYEKYKASKR